MASEQFKVNTTLQLRNMVGKSCIRLIEVYFKNVPEIEVKRVELGFVELQYEPKKITPKQIESHIKEIGFGILKDQDEQLVEEIKIAAIELIHYAYNTNSLIRNSDYLSDKLCLPYTKLSKVFSEKTNSTLEKYLILLKIEKVKELLVNEDYTLSEIAYMLGYSSVHYLSNQFKKITGVTVSDFKKDPAAYRIPLDELLN